MRLTRQGWGAAWAGLFVVAFGLLLRRPLLLVGGGIIGAFLISLATVYVRQLDRTIETLHIDQRTERDRVVARRNLAVTLAVSLPEPSPLQLTVESRPPVSTTVAHPESSQLTIGVGGDEGETTYLASWPHAGTVKFDPPAITATDRLGLFQITMYAGSTPRVTITPPAPREIHVGIGGERLTSGYGEHGSGRTGAGLKPAELREYVPGDAATRIDWKTTARLAEPYVREFEVETDRRTAMFLDHHSAMGVGPEGETKLDYLREVALAFVASARAFDDPLGCYTVGDEGLTARWLPAADRDQYARIERHLGDLTTTPARSPRSTKDQTGPAVARMLVRRLAGDQSAFGLSLRPYFEAAQSYIERIDQDPIYRTVRQAREKLQGPVWTVLFTDDNDPAAVRQAVSVARRGEGRVIVYLAPSALFEPAGLADLEAAYDRYVEFEEFRRELSRPDRVAAYEVAPGDRLDAVLSTGRRRRRHSGSSGGG